MPVLQETWATPSPQQSSAFVTPSPGPPMVAPPAISRPHAPARGGGRGARHPSNNGTAGAVLGRPRYGAVSGAAVDGGVSGRGGGMFGAGGAGTPAGASGNGQRWKFLDEGKLRKVSGKLFPEPTPPARCAPHPTLPSFTSLASRKLHDCVGGSLADKGALNARPHSFILALSS